MNDLLRITNDGKRIVSTNYYESDWNKRGVIAVSLNAGAMRLLIPNNMVEQVQRELMTMQNVDGYISVEHYHDSNFTCGKIFRIMFDDLTENPYCLFVGENQFVGLTVPDDYTRDSMPVLFYFGGDDDPLEYLSRVSPL